MITRDKLISESYYPMQTLMLPKTFQEMDGKCEAGATHE